MFALSGEFGRRMITIKWDKKFLVEDNLVPVSTVEEWFELYHRFQLFEKHMGGGPYVPLDNRIEDPIYCYIFLTMFFFKAGTVELVRGERPVLPSEPNLAY